MSRDKSTDGVAGGGAEDAAVLLEQRYRLLAAMDEKGMTWRGVHTQQQVGVAVKFWGPPMGYRQLERGLRAWVRLLHPGLTLVLDHGVVDGAAAASKVGPWGVGWVYSVVEYVGGTGRGGGAGLRLEDVTDWGTLQRLLLAGLDVLSFAHARGVWHLSLRPGNVLFDQGASGPGQWRLTDWALQEESGAAQGSEVSLEQARFLAPEQIAGDRRAQGPHTDLYALGCLAYWLCCGRPPFDGAQSFEVTLQHLRMPPPPFGATRFAVPDGFEAWVGGLLQKQPAQRVGQAARAAKALLRLVDPVQAQEARASWGAGVESFTGLALDVSKVWLPGAPPEPVSAGEATLPPSWRPLLHWQPLTHLRGVGLELLARRQLPSVGHEQARDALWASLNVVALQQAPKAVWVTGTEGLGKHTLTRWLRQRVVELGGALAMDLPHATFDAPGEGLRRGLEHLLKTWRLEADQLKRRATQALEALSLPEGASAAVIAGYLTALLRATITTPSTSISGALVGVATQESADEEAAALSVLNRGGLGSLDERLRLISLLLQAMCVHPDDPTRATIRPIVMCIESPRAGLSEATLLADYLVRTCPLRPLPVLCVLLDVYESPEPPIGSHLLALREEPSTVSIPLQPLPPKSLHALLTQHGPAPALLDHMTAAANGSPLLAALHLEDALERGHLALGRQGFRYNSPSPPPVLPLETLWLERVQRLLQQWPDHEQHIGRFALEIASALGAHIDAENWRAICRTALINIPEGLTEGLVSCGLARGTAWGWSFRHETLRRSIEQDAIRRGRWADHQRRCAAYFQGLASHNASTSSPWLDPNGRRARHLIAAGDDADALEPLVRASLGALADQNTALARMYLNLHRGCLERTLAPGATPRAAAMNQRVLTLCAAADPFVVPAATPNPPPSAGELAEQAYVLAQQLTSPPLITHAALTLALCTLTTDPARSRQLMQRATPSSPGSPPPPLSPLLQADDALAQNDLPRARRFAVTALASALQGGLATQAHAANLRLGHCMRRLGQLHDAHRTLLRTTPPPGSPLFDLQQLEIALIIMRDGQFREAVDLLEPILPRATHLPAFAQVRYHLARACCAACRCNAARLQDAWSRLPSGPPTPDEELAWLSTRTGNFAVAARLFPLARNALRLALSLWEALDQTEEQEKVRFTLQQIARW